MREDWVECTFGEIIYFKNGFAFKSSDYINEGIPVIRIGDISQNQISIQDSKRVKESNDLDEYLIKKGDILIAMSGATTGKFGMYNLYSKAYLNQRVGNIFPKSKNLVFKPFLFYLLHFLKRQIEKDAYGGAQPNISSKKIEEMKVPFIPLPEQRAIVKKIEALFSSLDAGIADLKKAQDQLKIYRQAVLKKAFEGELTKEWREKKTDLPTAEELLVQIEEQRQAYYEKQIENLKEAVAIWEKNEKEGKKPTKPKSLINFPMDTPQIVNNRLNVKIGNVYSVFIGSTPSRSTMEYWENGDIKWVSSGEVAFNRIYDTKEKITEKGLLNTSTSLHPEGTIVLAMIGEGKTRGQAAILKTVACHNQNTAAIRMLGTYTIPEYLYYFLLYNYENSRRIGSGNNQKALNQEVINNLVIPFCSAEEQAQIVKEIESRLSVCDAVEQQIKDSLSQAEALRQSILKKAFEGKLLSNEEIKACQQASDYEPAAVLLEKIKAEKEAHKLVKKSKKK